jgi:hypothetical protein
VVQRLGARHDVGGAVRNSGLLGDAGLEAHVGRRVAGFGDLPHLVERLDADDALGVGRPEHRRDAGAAAEIDDESRPPRARQLQEHVHESRRRFRPVSVIASAEPAPRVAGAACIEERVVRR